MNCNKCGSPLAPGSINCNVCGAPVGVPVNNQGINQNIVVPNPGVSQGVMPSVGNASIPMNSPEPTINPVVQEVNNAQPMNSPQGISNNPVQAAIPANNPFVVNQPSTGVSQTPVSSQVPINNNADSFNTIASVQSVGPTPAPAASNFQNASGSTNVLETPNPATPSINSSNPIENNQGVQVANEVPPTMPTANNNVISNQPTLEEVTAKPKKKNSKIGLIIVIVLIVAVVAFFVFQYISLTNQANTIKNRNNANNSQLNNKSENIISEDAYETITHQDEYYVAYTFDFNTINSIYEKDYSVGNHKVKISISTDKTGNISIDGATQELKSPVINIYHLLKSNTLFIENQILTNESELYVYSGNNVVNMSSLLTNANSIQNVKINNNSLEFTSLSWKENNIFNGTSTFNVCQDGYNNFVTDDFAVETLYTFDLKEVTYSVDKLKSNVSKTIKQLYDQVCPATSQTPVQTPTDGAATQTPQPNPVTP